MIPYTASLYVGICRLHQRFYVKAAVYMLGSKKSSKSIIGNYSHVESTLT